LLGRSFCSTGRSRKVSRQLLVSTWLVSIACSESYISRRFYWPSIRTQSHRRLLAPSAAWSRAIHRPHLQQRIRPARAVAQLLETVLLVPEESSWSSSWCGGANADIGSGTARGVTAAVLHPWRLCRVIELLPGIYTTPSRICITMHARRQRAMFFRFPRSV
jgi:hypothetical protein